MMVGDSSAIILPLNSAPKFRSTTILGLTTYTATCGEHRVSYETCKVFIQEFETLYAGRNESEYPYSNPMRYDPALPIDADGGMILFPTKYNFEQDMYGGANAALPDLTSISTVVPGYQAQAPYGSGSMIQFAGTNGEQCLTCWTQGCSARVCNYYTLEKDQKFEYDVDTFQIKLPDYDGFCLGYDLSSDDYVLDLFPCSSSLAQVRFVSSAILECRILIVFQMIRNGGTTP